MQQTKPEQYQATGIKPDSVDGFQCTMGNCEDNCCRNTTWKITVDKDTYEKYKTLDTKLGEHIMNCIEESGDQLVFKEFDHGHCPLLAESGLCTIHRDLGPDFLCKTCTTYPRVWNSWGGKMEYWLSLSCPDVIRWVLYRKKRINYMKFPVVSDAPVEEATPVELEKRQVSDMLIEIAHHRKFTLKEKIIFMGLFMRSLGKSPVNETIETYRANMRKPETLKQLQSIPSTIDQNYRSDIFAILAKAAQAAAKPPKVIPKGIKNSEYYVQIGRFNLEVADGKADYLTDAFDRMVVPYVNDNSHVFENYLVYTIMTSSFLKEADDYATAFAGYAGIFITMLVYTVGLFKSNQTLTHDEMIVGMYLYHRNVSHNQKFKNQLSAAFNNNLLGMLLGALGGIK